jgi:hypothetical protein
MTGLVRKATLLGVCGLLAAATALANVPDPGTSDHVLIIPVVGTNAGVPHPGHAVGGTIRDFAGNPVSGATVTLDFSGCTEFRLCDAVVAGSGTVTCVGSTVSVVTDAAGQWGLTVLGSTTVNSPAQIQVGSGQDCVEIRAGSPGVVINNATAWVMDIRNSENGVNPFDLSTWKADYLCATGSTCAAHYFGRLDCFGADHVISPFDLSTYKSKWNSNGSLNGCPASYCP